VTQQDIELEPKKYWNQYKSWCHKNIFTVIGVLVILGMVWWNYSSCDSQKLDIANECNTHWRLEVAGKCPQLINSSGWMDMDLGSMYEREEIGAD